MQLAPFERIDDLQLDGLRLIQNMQSFCFGIDAVLLSNFPEIRPGAAVLDLCTGSAVIPILLSAKSQARSIDALELDPQTAEMAGRSIELNHLEGRLSITCGDARQAQQYYIGRKFHVITCNPPYGTPGSGKLSPNEKKAAARHELSCTLEDICRESAKLLEFNGKLCMVHRATRLCDIVSTMRQHKIEPKRLQLIHPREGKEANLLLIEGAMGGKPGLKVLPPIYVHAKGDRP